MRELHIVAGPNGAGKSTIFDTLIPEGLEYINADLIAKQIKEKAGGRNTQDLANHEASAIFFEKVKNGQAIAIETNLSDVETYKSFMGIQNLGYKVYMYFMSVDDVNICIDRVRQRVLQGGHNVNPDVIQQRYTVGLALLKHYRDFPDVLTLIDNSGGRLRRQAKLHKGKIQQLANPCKKWVNNLLEDGEKKAQTRESKSIEEVRRLYKKGKGI